MVSIYISIASCIEDGSYAYALMICFFVLAVTLFVLMVVNNWYIIMVN